MKLKQFAMVAAAAALVLGYTTSCKKDEGKSAPTITIKDAGDSKEITSTKTFPVIVRVKVDKDLSLKSLTQTFTYTKADGSKVSPKEATVLKTEKSKTTDDYVAKVEFTIPADCTKGGTMTFKATDSNGGVTEKVLTVGDETTPKPAGTPMTVRASMQNAAAFSHCGSAVEGAYDLKAGKAVSAFDTKATISMINNSPKGASSAFNPGWTSGSWDIDGTGGGAKTAHGDGTEFVKVEGVGTDHAAVAAFWANATVEKCKELFDKGSKSTIVQSVKPFDFYIARKGSDIYLIGILSVDAKKNHRAATGHIKFMYSSGVIK